MRQFIGGLLLGTVITLISGALVGPEVTLSNVGSGNGGGPGKYDFRIEEKDGHLRYVMLDTVGGVATVMNSDGTVVTVKAAAGAQDEGSDE